MRIIALVTCLLLPSLARAITYNPSFDNSCGSDVSAAINAYITGTVVDGTPGAWNTLQMNVGCYRIDAAPITFTQRNYLTFRGAAQLKNVVPYPPSTSRSVILVDRGSNITISDFTLIGTNADDGGYDGATEHEYGVQVLGATNLTIERNYIRNFNGDSISINPGGSYDGNGVGATVADNVLIQNNSLYSTGRHGVTINHGSNIFIRSNIFDKIGYTAIDPEVEAPAWYIRNLKIENNTFGKSFISTLTVSHTQGTFTPQGQNNGIRYANNRVIGPRGSCTPTISIYSNPSDITVESNILESVGFPMDFEGAQNVAVRNNRSSGAGCGAESDSRGIATNNGGSNFSITNNVFPDNPVVWKHQNGTAATNITATGNHCGYYTSWGGACPEITP